MARKYYLYAGYYELWITDKVLRRPLTLISTHRSFRTAYEAAWKFDEDANICYDTSIREDVGAYFSWLESDRINDMPFYDGTKYNIENGLTGYTLEGIKLCPDLAPTSQCLSDIINYLHAKAGVSLRRAHALCEGKNYGQLGTLINNLVPTT